MKIDAAQADMRHAYLGGSAGIFASSLAWLSAALVAHFVSPRAGIAALTEAFTPDIAEALHARGERLRGRINARFARHGVAMTATGEGSLMTIHGRAGPITRPADLASSDDRAKELLFLDLLERGFYIARRGFIALTVAITDAHEDAFLAALDGILSARRSVLPAELAAAASDA